MWLEIKNGTFQHSETVFYIYQLTGSIFERERQTFTTHPWERVQTQFLTSSRPWHALRCLLWICNYSPQGSVKKKIFFFFLHSVLSYQIQMRALFASLLLNKSIISSKTGLHHNTSWKSRHLVFSHITSEKTWSSSCVQFTSGTIYKNMIRKSSNPAHCLTFATLFTASVRCHGRSSRPNWISFTNICCHQK